MKKLLIITSLILFVGIIMISGQAEKKEQQWYCVAETVKPDMREQYLELSQELIQLCKEENFPFAFHTWSYHPMEFELWSPLESLDDIEMIKNEWEKIIKKWGEEKYAAFNATKIKNYTKTCNVRWDLQFYPSMPDYNLENANYERWIEIYLKPGTGKEFEEAFRWISERRKEHEYKLRCNYAECGLGYETPSILVMYQHESLLGYLEYENGLGEAYKADFQKYLNRVRKLFAKPVKMYDIYYISDLSYTPNQE